MEEEVEDAGDRQVLLPPLGSPQDHGRARGMNVIFLVVSSSFSTPSKSHIATLAVDSKFG